jgi:alpha-amylase
MSSLINFGFKYTAKSAYDTVFTKYFSLSNEKYPGNIIANYLSSHDDGDPFDKNREKGYEAANKLLLSSGAAQIYYGDESNRDINAQADGDAKLRSFMNWEEQKSDKAKQDILSHWQKVGKFRKKYDAVTKGSPAVISVKPYLDMRSTATSTVIVGLEQPIGEKTLDLGGKIADGTLLLDEYSGQEVKVKGGKLTINTPFNTVLLSKI